LVLGFSSRLIVEQKRVDRLPGLCARLDEAGLAYRFEFLGEGPDRPWLEQQFPDRSRFVFHGCKVGPDYWRVLGEWDAVVSLSDYEGTPLSLLEAMSMGAVPIYPRLGSGGDDYATRVRPDLLYQPGDLAEVARIARNLAGLANDEMQVLRGRCEHAVASHLGDNYLTGFAKHIRKVLTLPRISRRKARSSLWLLERFSFGQLARIRAMGQAGQRLWGR
jgi:glycosyltransferase involved in cell wall biosynthesis